MIIDLILFHVAWMMTSVEGFSLVEKSTVSWHILQGFVWLISPIHMYLLMLAAGTSAMYSLSRRSPVPYLKERARRLLIPLLFFMAFLFPVLGYFWPPAQFAIGTDYLRQFWPWCLATTFYSPVTGGPNWGHMWFVGYLLIYSLALLPVFLRIRSGKSGCMSSLTGFLTAGRGRIFLVGVPIALTFAVLSPIWPFFRNNLYSDWGYFTYNLTAFFTGFIIARDERWREAFDRHMFTALALGAALSAAKMWMQYAGLSSPAYDARYAVYSIVAGFNTWAWVIALLSLARRKLSFTNGFLRYFNRIAYPFYIFHLVVITVAGYFITRLRLGTVMEFAVLSAVSFAATLGLCEISRRNRVTRFLLGIK